MRFCGWICGSSLRPSHSPPRFPDFLIPPFLSLFSTFSPFLMLRRRVESVRCERRSTGWRPRHSRRSCLPRALSTDYEKNERLLAVYYLFHGWSKKRSTRSRKAFRANFPKLLGRRPRPLPSESQTVSHSPDCVGVSMFHYSVSRQLS